MTGLPQFLNIQSTNHVRALWGRNPRLAHCQNIFWHFLVSFKNKQNGSLLREKGTIVENLLLKVTDHRHEWKTRASTQAQEEIQKHWALCRCFKNSLVSLCHLQQSSLPNCELSEDRGELMACNFLSLKPSLWHVRYSRSGCWIRNKWTIAEKMVWPMGKYYG